MSPSASFVARVRRTGTGFPARIAVCCALAGLIAPSAQAQDAANQAPAPTQGGNGTIRFRLPSVTVTAQKEPEDVQEVPVSVTAVTSETLEADGIQSVSEAAQFAPNTFFNEFSARKLSNARFRGIGSSPNNPGVTTYLDGVPQLNANSSSTELIDVGQIEFVRGPQGALFGRNTLGGLVNITSARPSFKNWSGRLNAPFGNFGEGGFQGSASGPLIADKLALGVGIGFSRRDGFTRNSVTGNDLDSRSALFTKLQALWTPAQNWTIRGILSAERARDGDYALNDLASLRANGFVAARDYEGFTNRDIIAPTLLVNREGRKLDFSSTTGFVRWKTDDSTDLDYTPAPLIRRANDERDHQFTQEFRVSSARTAALSLARDVTLTWQAGLFIFTQNYSQDAVNSFAPSVLSSAVTFPVDQHSPQSELDDHGLGVYGQGTFTFRRGLRVSVGVRGDHETKNASLNTFFSPPIFPPAVVKTDAGFGDVSPQFVVSYPLKPGKSVYATAARGFKAGGFNAASPPGSEAYGQEHSWNYEGGVKTSWLDQRLAVNGAIFYINWQDLQVNVPNPFVPAQFFIGNAGSATSKGVEVEITARPLSALDLFGGFGYTNARFGQGSTSGGVDVSGNRISNSPQYTANVGAQYSRAVMPGATMQLRAELASYGNYQYDDANTVGQSAYALVNFRGGVHFTRYFVEGWVRNAFNTFYIVTAFAYPGLAPSGFVGESAAPRTFGVRAGVTF
jgi:iron complex outermembrane recepter protein